MDNFTEDQIADNFDGSSREIFNAMLDGLVKDGGFTFTLDWNDRINQKASRYVVGDGREGMVLDGIDELTPANIGPLLINAAADYEGIGGWVDDGRVYIDPVSSHTNLDVAMYLARMRGEMAIWDSHEHKSLEVIYEDADVLHV